jgi:hypothetical protein
VRVSVASYVKDELDECVDMIIDTDPPTDPVAAAKGMETKPLAEPCAETFRDRIVLATCTATKTGDGKPKNGKLLKSMKLVSTYYRFSTVVDTDLFMKQCHEAGGKWEALPRDSDKFKEAERQNDRKRLRGAVDKLQ